MLSPHVHSITAVLDSRLRGNDAPVVMPAPAYARAGSGGHPQGYAVLRLAFM